MKTKIIIGMLALVALLIVACSPEKPLDNTNNTNQTSLIAPIEVLNKYEEMSAAYNISLGGILQSCEKGNERIFVVIGGGGFVGENYYYNREGKLLGMYQWDDMIEPNEPQPPINTEDYDCKVLKQSFSFGPQIEVSTVEDFYLPGEEVKIRIKNNEETPVYFDNIGCEQRIWEVYSNTNSEEPLMLKDPEGFYPAICYTGNLKLNPGEEVTLPLEYNNSEGNMQTHSMWNQKYYQGSRGGLAQASAGTYRIVFPRVYVGEVDCKNTSDDPSVSYDCSSEEFFDTVKEENFKQLEVEVRIEGSLKCQINADCKCRVFDGTKFLEGTSQGTCDLPTKTCKPCTYF